MALSLEEINSKIAQLQKAIDSPATPAAQKTAFKSIIEKLESQKPKEKVAESKVGTKPFTEGQGSKVTDKDKAAEAEKRGRKKGGKKKAKATKFRPENEAYDTWKEKVISELQKLESINKETATGAFNLFKTVVDKSFKNHEGVLVTAKRIALASKKKFETRDNSKTEPKATASAKANPYDCDDLIAKEKERKQKSKAAAEKRADEPKKTPATRNKIAIEKVAERITTNITKRIDKGEVKRAELEKLIGETKILLKNLEAALKKL